MGQQVSDLERIESLKAGGLGAIAFTGTYLIALGIQYFFLESLTVGIMTIGLKIAIAGLSGFLFAVTYRYIIRCDNNSHLKDGAVLAFGLVRGLVPVELSGNLMDNLGQLSFLAIESLCCFTMARFCLDFAFARCWIKPFSSSL